MAESIREYLSKLGKRGADATNSQLTPAERQKKARRAAEARWEEHRKALKKTTAQGDRTLARLEQAAERISEGSKALTKLNRTNTRRRKKATPRD
jgi:chromosome segregation ATPase